MRPGHRKRLPNWGIGLIAVVILTIASFLAFSKKLPWTEGYRVKAVFATAQNVAVNSPVRIAGVNVGKVVEVESLTSDDPAFRAATGELPPDEGPPGEQGAIVTMELTDEGLPLHEDATMKLRPRLFLEGNLFVDLKPGTPSAPEAEDGYVFGPDQTASSVQLDQVLTTLQSDVRSDLQIFLAEFGDALVKYGGAESFQELYRTSPGAFKYTSLVNEALLGTQEHDLSGMIANLDSTVQTLSQDLPALQDLVTNAALVTGAFGENARDLKEAVAILPGVLDAAVLDKSDPSDNVGAFDSLRAALPSLSRFADQALPGVRSADEAIDAATPLLHQVRGLVSEDELRGLVHDLRPAVPELITLTDNTIPFLEESRALSSCFNEVVIPWSNDEVVGPPGYSHPAVGKVYEETGYGLAGISGESRSGDANGQYIRVAAGGGANTLVPGNGFTTVVNPESSPVPFAGFLSAEILGSVPSIQDSAKTPFRPDAPCEEQDQPNLRSLLGPAPPQTPAKTDAAAQPAALQSLTGEAKSYLSQIAKASILADDGQRSQANSLMKDASGSWEDFQRELLPGLVGQLKALGGGG